MTYDPDAILADPDAHPIHKTYAEVNIRIRDLGEHWAKCANCGDLYRYDTPEWYDSTVCSSSCHAAFVASLVGEL